jgi:LPS export ABC transporter protein LptC
MVQIFKKILYFGLACLFLGCQSQEQQSIAPPNYDGPDQEGWNSRVTVTSNGRTAAVIQYAHMEKYSKRREARFDGGIVVDFYNTEGKHTSNLVADGGLLDEETNEVEAISNVVVVSDSGITLRTQRLRWDSARQKIVSNEFVTITTTGGDTLYGIGFESDQNLRRWSIGKPSGVTAKKIDLAGGTKTRSGRTDSLPSSFDSPGIKADSVKNETKKALMKKGVQ